MNPANVQVPLNSTVHPSHFYPAGRTVVHMNELSFELYEDRAGKWRWRLVHSSGHIVADSGEGYSTKDKARESIELVRFGAEDAEVADIDQNRY